MNDQGNGKVLAATVAAALTLLLINAMFGAPDLPPNVTMARQLAPVALPSAYHATSSKPAKTAPTQATAAYILR